MTARRLEADDGRLVASHVEEARSLWSRFIGLMLRPELAEGHGLLLAPCNQVHMFFMRFPIDVAYLDREGRVKRVYHRLRPWRVTRVVFGAKAAVELPAGSLAAAGVEPGMVLRLV